MQENLNKYEIIVIRIPDSNNFVVHEESERERTYHFNRNPAKHTDLPVGASGQKIYDLCSQSCSS